MLCVIGIDGLDVLVVVFDVERRSAGIDVLSEWIVTEITNMNNMMNQNACNEKEKRI